MLVHGGARAGVCRVVGLLHANGKRPMHCLLHDHGEKSMGQPACTHSRLQRPSLALVLCKRTCIPMLCTHQGLLSRAITGTWRKGQVQARMCWQQRLSSPSTILVSSAGVLWQSCVSHIKCWPRMLPRPLGVPEGGCQQLSRVPVCTPALLLAQHMHNHASLPSLPSCRFAHDDPHVLAPGQGGAEHPAAGLQWWVWWCACVASELV